jgi:hypothetical protein
MTHHLGRMASDKYVTREMSQMITLIEYFGSMKALRFRSIFFEVYVFWYVCNYGSIQDRVFREIERGCGIRPYVCVCPHSMKSQPTNRSNLSQKLKFALKIPFVQSSIHMPRPSTFSIHH